MAARKVTVNLPESTIEALTSVADKRGITMTEAIRQAIANEKFLQDVREEGSQILIKDVGNKLQQVRFVG